MEESVIIEKLSAFGLGRQEATIYVCLLKNNALTGYEVGKITGISRSNVYSTLNALVEHGAAHVIEGTPSRYISVGIEEFCDNRIRYMERLRKELDLADLSAVKNAEGYVTVEGYQHICDKIYHMLTGVEMRIYFSAESSFLSKWEREIEALVQNGKKVVLISNGVDELFPDNEVISTGAIRYEMPDKSPEKRKQIRLIIDSAYVLTGEIEGGSNDTCLYSGQKNFVAVFKDALKNEIELIKLKEKDKRRLG